MSVDEQNLSEELEKLETMSRKRADPTVLDDNPFQRRSKCFSRSVPLWPAKCYCPYIKRPTRNTVPFKRHSGKILKQPVFKYALHSYQNDLKLEDLSESLPSDACSNEKPKQCDSYTQETDNSGSDVSIYELASYFELLVDIPKQMSTMAEMMYT